MQHNEIGAILGTTQEVSLRNRILNAFEHRLNIGFVLIAAALLRMASIPLVRNFLHPQTWEFGTIARIINSGLGYTTQLPNGTRAPSAYMPPGYTYLLAWVLRLGGDRPITFLAIEIVQAALGVLLVYVVYRTAAILLGHRGAIAAACMTAIYPAQVYMCNEIHSISIYIVLGSSAVFFLVRYLEESSSWKDVIAGGVCMGLMILFRPEALALVLLYAAILVWRRGRRAIGQAAVFVLVAYACLAPWTIRNYLAFGKIVPVSNNGGLNLWLGHNPQATGSQHYSYFNPVPEDLQRAWDQLPLDRAWEVGRDQALAHSAVEFIRTHPKRECYLALRKLSLFFLFDPSHDKSSSPVYWVPSVLLTLLALYGATLQGKKLLREDLLLVVTILLAVAVSVVVVVLPRYKIVIDPFLIILASVAFVHE